MPASKRRPARGRGKRWPTKIPVKQLVAFLAQQPTFAEAWQEFRITAEQPRGKR